MIRKLVFVAALAGFLTAVSISAQSQQAYPNAQNNQQDQQSAKVQSVTGKVTQVETGGKAFSMNVSQGSSSNQPMRFVVDKNTTVQGHVAAGTTANVDYQSDGSGQLVAVSVREASQQSQ